MNYYLLNIIISQAEAAPESSSGGGLGAMLPIILMFAIIYFLIIRPQSKQAKEHKRFVHELKRGDTVTTQGGMIGKIVEVSPDIIHLEIAHNVKIKVLRGQVSMPYNPKPKQEKENGKEKKKGFN